MALCALHLQLTKLVWHVLVEVMDKPASADFYGLSCTVHDTANKKTYPNIQSEISNKQQLQWRQTTESSE